MIWAPHWAEDWTKLGLESTPTGKFKSNWWFETLQATLTYPKKTGKGSSLARVLARDMLVPRRINLLEKWGEFHWTAFFFKNLSSANLPWIHCRTMGFKLMKLQWLPPGGKFTTEVLKQPSAQVEFDDHPTVLHPTCRSLGWKICKLMLVVLTQQVT